MSFLQRLKDNNALTDQSVVLTDKEVDVEAVAQLDVDVVQTENSVVVYAQAAGANIYDVHIAIEGEDNIVIIEGQRKRPFHLVEQGHEHDSTFFVEECTWGKFYRRIILPQRIDIKNAEAKIKDGILILVLPLIHHSNENLGLCDFISS